MSRVRQRVPPALAVLVWVLLSFCFTSCTDASVPGSATRPGRLTIHLIPHSHTDPGWVATYESYYGSSVVSILDSVMTALDRDSARRFVWSEISYFRRWYDSLPHGAITQASVKRFIETGQLEIAGGGYVMTDEAVASLDAVVDAITLGHKWLYQTFGIAPRVGWQIDAFGHSPALSVDLFTRLSGLQVVVLNRVPFTVKEKWIRSRAMMFRWQNPNSAAAGAAPPASIAAHVLYDHYSAPSGMDFTASTAVQWAATPKPEVDLRLDQSPGNFGYRRLLRLATHLVTTARLQSSAYTLSAATDEHVMVLVGDDFRFTMASGQFRSWEIIRDFINDSENRQSRAAENQIFEGVTVRLSTPAEYFSAAVRSRLIAADSRQHSDIRIHSQFGRAPADWTRAFRLVLPVVESGSLAAPPTSDQLMPYANSRFTHWTGFYASYPFFKGLFRVAEANVLAAEQLIAIAQIRGLSVATSPGLAKELTRVIRRFDNRLNAIRLVASLLAHHDAITGTSSPHVMTDCGWKAIRTIDESSSLIVHVLNFIHSNEYAGPKLVSFTPKFDLVAPDGTAIVAAPPAPVVPALPPSAKRDFTIGGLRAALPNSTQTLPYSVSTPLDIESLFASTPLPLLFYNPLNWQRRFVHCIPVKARADGKVTLRVSRNAAAAAAVETAEPATVQWIPELTVSDSLKLRFSTFKGTSTKAERREPTLQRRFVWHSPPKSAAAPPPLLRWRACFEVTVPAVGMAAYDLSAVTREPDSGTGSSEPLNITIYTPQSAVATDDWSRFDDELYRFRSLVGAMKVSVQAIETAPDTVWFTDSAALSPRVGLCARNGGLICAIQSSTDSPITGLWQSFGVYHTSWSGAYIFRTDLGMYVAVGFGQQIAYLCGLHAIVWTIWFGFQCISGISIVLCCCAPIRAIHSALADSEDIPPSKKLSTTAVGSVRVANRRSRWRVGYGLLWFGWCLALMLLTAAVFILGLRAERDGGAFVGRFGAVMFVCMFWCRVLVIERFSRAIGVVAYPYDVPTEMSTRIWLCNCLKSLFRHTAVAAAGVGLGFVCLRAYHMQPLSFAAPFNNDTGAVNLGGTFAVISGPLITESVSVSNAYPLAQTVRVYHTRSRSANALDPTLAFDSSVELIVHGRALPEHELFLRLRAVLFPLPGITAHPLNALPFRALWSRYHLAPPLSTRLYTDSGTRINMLRNLRTAVSTISANQFPVQSHASVQYHGPKSCAGDRRRTGCGQPALSLTTSQSLGVSSFCDGCLDVAIHRFPIRDDGLGLSSGVDDTRPATLRLWLSLDDDRPSEYLSRVRSLTLNRPVTAVYGTYLPAAGDPESSASAVTRYTDISFVSVPPSNALLLGLIAIPEPAPTAGGALANSSSPTGESLGLSNPPPLPARNNLAIRWLSADSSVCVAPAIQFSGGSGDGRALTISSAQPLALSLLPVSVPVTPPLSVAGDSAQPAADVATSMPCIEPGTVTTAGFSLVRDASSVATGDANRRFPLCGGTGPFLSEIMFVFVPFAVYLCYRFHTRPLCGSIDSPTSSSVASPIVVIPSS